MDNKKLIPISDIFKKSFTFYKSRFYLVITLAFIPFTNFVILSLLYEIIGSKINNVVFIPGIGILTLLFMLFAVVVNFWVQVTYFYIIKEQNITKDVKGLLAFSWNKIASYAWILFLMGVITVAGFIALVVPGVIFLVWFSMSLYIFVFEDVKGMQALSRSKELVKGYFWPILGRLFIFGLLTGLITWIPVVGNVINIFLMMPLGVIYGYFIYESLKELKAN